MQAHMDKISRRSFIKQVGQSGAAVGVYSGLLSVPGSVDAAGTTGGTTGTTAAAHPDITE